ncbi:hypothetical protein PENTCL1PPCAC_9047, partial [Pristionchus entomophagus]
CFLISMLYLSITSASSSSNSASLCLASVSSYSGSCLKYPSGSSAVIKQLRSVQACTLTSPLCTPLMRMSKQPSKITTRKPALAESPPFECRAPSVVLHQ